MKKIGILIENQFDEQELIYPYHRLREDYEVILIGSQAGVEYAGKTGLKMKSDIASSDVDYRELSGLVIPGGFSPDFMRRTQATKDLVKELDEAKTPMAAICHGPWMFASSAEIAGKDMTSFFAIKDDLKNAGANWVDKEVVVSGHLVTSRTPKDLPIFIKTFIELVEE
ncbi:MAG: type 1 glutamine amidotransferase [Tissierellia bacterium]|nr:type 1 glutamine amidotransferase [Tissierellia bacterium]